jgi:hypothetical protein
MAAYNKFQNFVEDLAKGVHQLHAAGHVLKIYLSNTTPDAAADAVKGDLAEITNENGYTAPIDIENDYSESGGTGTLVGTDKTITAAGGTVGPFRYVPLYNDTPAGPVDPLIAWWDYGSGLTLQNGESFTYDVGASIFTLA